MICNLHPGYVVKSRYCIRKNFLPGSRLIKCSVQIFSAAVANSSAVYKKISAAVASSFVGLEALLYKPCWFDHFVHCIVSFFFRGKLHVTSQQIYITGTGVNQFCSIAIFPSLMKEWLAKKVLLVLVHIKTIISFIAALSYHLRFWLL